MHPQCLARRFIIHAASGLRVSGNAVPAAAYGKPLEHQRSGKTLGSHAVLRSGQRRSRCNSWNKAYIRTYAIEGLRDVIAMGGSAEQGLIKFVSMMTKFAGLEGVTLMDAKDTFEGHSHTAFSGLADVLREFGQQLSGALGIPLVRLFGQSPQRSSAPGTLTCACTMTPSFSSKTNPSRWG